MGSLNARASGLVEALPAAAEQLRIAVRDVPEGGRLFDFGVETEGGLGAGLALAQVCTSGLSEVSLVPGQIGESAWTHVLVATDHPVPACLYSQLAGWAIKVEKFFAMGSGPMRAAAADEDLFRQLAYRECAPTAVGVLEGRQLPSAAVFRYVAEKTRVPADRVNLLIAPTASAAGSLQVVARVVETAMHKLLHLGFDVKRVRSAAGTAPLAPVAKNDLAGIGRTNDAVLYGGRVTFWVRGDDESISEIGPQVPSVASPSYGAPFLDIFEQAGRDFYKIDQHLFSPAEVTFENLDTGRVQHFGRTNAEVLRRSFGL